MSTRQNRKSEDLISSTRSGTIHVANNKRGHDKGDTAVVVTNGVTDEEGDDFVVEDAMCSLTDQSSEAEPMMEVPAAMDTPKGWQPEAN